MNRLAVLALLATIVLGGSAAYDWYRFDLVTHGVVIAERVTPRKGNADSYAAALTQPLPEGTEFRLLERRGDWILLRLPGGQEGWIRTSTSVLF